jgi:hypothetical protein
MKEKTDTKNTLLKSVKMRQVIQCGTYTKH